MKKNIAGLLFAGICLILVSCSKEEIAGKKIYYGNIQGEVKALPGTPAMDIYASGNKILTMESGGFFGLGGTISVIAGEPIVLQFKKKDEDVVLVDTTFTILKGETATFKVAYSEEFGLKGFVQPRLVAADSISIQFSNMLSEKYSPEGGVDLYVCKYGLYTGEVMDTTAILSNFEKGKPMPVLTLAADDPNNSTFMYVGMLKKRQTGEFILNQDSSIKIFIILNDWFYYPGKFSIGVIRDESGFIYTELIDL